MKLVSYQTSGLSRFGIVKEDGIVNLTNKLDVDDIRGLLETGQLAKAKEFENDPVDHRLDEVTILPVIPYPDKIICAGVNYDAHRRETNREKLANPIIFFRVPSSQTGHEQPMLIPVESDKFDYEGEIAVVIGKKGRRIAMEDAFDYIAGYSCYNDGSVRDWQFHTSQWGPGKNFEATGGFGPWLVTKDEIADEEVLTLETRLNGEVVQSSDTSYLLFSIRELITYVSTFTTLLPGDVIVTGTPGGVGVKRDPQVFMKEGDVVEVEVSKIGVLRNVVKKEQN
jgi:2-keto-4-pentenoate hydratase/2-oxohepta-3-ene-1,7-dioic acid hydratase in catechol pathway